MKNIFDKTSSTWVRYSKYTFRKASDGTLYIAPAKNADPIICEPFKDAEKMVLDAVNTGLLCMDSERKDEAKSAIMDFVSTYGLLGLMTAMPTTPKFMEYEYVYLPKNDLIRDETMQTEEYIKLFYPFDTLEFVKHGVESIWDVANDKTMIALAMTFSERPTAVNMSFQRQYAERYDWLFAQFKTLAFIALTPLFFYEDGVPDEAKKLYQMSIAAYAENAPTYHIALLDKPTIVWHFESLLLCIKMMLSFMIADDDNPLTVCSHCRMAFMAGKPGQKYCSEKCRREAQR